MLIATVARNLNVSSAAVRTAIVENYFPAEEMSSDGKRAKIYNDASCLVYMHEAINGPALFRDFAWNNLKDRIIHFQEIAESWKQHEAREVLRKSTVRECYPDVNWDEQFEDSLGIVRLSVEEQDGLANAYDKEEDTIRKGDRTT